MLSKTIRSAPLLIGAFFCLGLSHCEQPAATSSKDNELGSIELAEAIEAASAAGKVYKPSDEVAFTFLSYNLKNWLETTRYIEGKKIRSHKPVKERAAIIANIHRAAPDILAVCEIGDADDLADFQTALKKVALDYPYVEHTRGADPIRHLALLSRFPISSRDSQTKLSFPLDGRTWLLQRGLLDVTIDTNIGHVRFLGLHLKSKREAKHASQAKIRLNEARLVRRKIESLIKTDPEIKLIVYGDLNDTRQSPTVRHLIGRRHSLTGLEIIDAKDDQGTLWTHHWKSENIYSRLDWVLSSRELTPYIDEKASRLLYSPQWETASDHRAILVPFMKK